MLLAPADGSLDRYSYFDGEVIANTDLLANADGYVTLARNPDLDQLAGASTLGSFFDFLASGDSANTFPYQLLVNDAAKTGSARTGNRYGISDDELIPNGGDGKGNYVVNATQRGWQRSNLARQSATLGDENSGWTGFDYLHAGQKALNVLQLRVLNEDPISLNLVVLAKYITPVRQTGFEAAQYRLPPILSGAPQAIDPVDSQTRDMDVIFAYRLPFGALDVSAISPNPLAPNQFTIDDSEPGQFGILVRDWDRNATVACGNAPLFDPIRDATQATHSMDRVPPGTNGPPVDVDLSFPASSGVSGTVQLTEAGSNSGEPGAEIKFAGSASYPFPSQHPGENYHETVNTLVRVVDPEALSPNLDDWVSYLGNHAPQLPIPPPDPLPPLQSAATRRQVPINYQVLPIRIDCAYLVNQSTDPTVEPVYVTTDIPAVVGGAAVTFELHTGGAELPTEFLWEFEPGSVFPETSSDPNPLVIPRLAGGSFVGRVRAVNPANTCVATPDGGLEFHYIIEPAPPWQHLDIVSGAAQARGRHPSVAVVPAGPNAGRIMVAYFDGTANDLMLVRETTAGSGSFRNPEVVDTGADPPAQTGGGTAGRFNDLVVADSAFAISYVSESATLDEDAIRVASRDYALWDTSWGSFTYSLIAKGNLDSAEFTSTGIDNMLSSASGLQPVVCYALSTPAAPAQVDLTIAWQNTSTVPLVPADWTKTVVDSTPRGVGPCFQSIAMFNTTSGRLLGYSQYQAQDYSLWASTSAEGLTIASSPGSAMLDSRMHRVRQGVEEGTVGNYCRLAVAKDPTAPSGDQDRLAIAYLSMPQVPPVHVFLLPSVAVANRSAPIVFNHWDSYILVPPPGEQSEVGIPKLAEADAACRPVDFEAVDGRMLLASWFPFDDPNVTQEENWGRILSWRSSVPFPTSANAWGPGFLMSNDSVVSGRHLSIAANPSSTKLFVARESEPEPGGVSQSTLRGSWLSAW